MFRNFNNQFMCPFMIYADFECNLGKIEPENEYKLPNGAFNLHSPCGIAYAIISSYNDIYKTKRFLYRGPDAVNKFIRQVINFKKKYLKFLIEIYQLK